MWDFPRYFANIFLIPSKADLATEVWKLCLHAKLHGNSPNGGLIREDFYACSGWEYINAGVHVKQLNIYAGSGRGSFFFLAA